MRLKITFSDAAEAASFAAAFRAEDSGETAVEKRRASAVWLTGPPAGLEAMADHGVTVEAVSD